MKENSIEVEQGTKKEQNAQTGMEVEDLRRKEVQCKRWKGMWIEQDIKNVMYIKKTAQVKRRQQRRRKESGKEDQ